MDPPKHGPRTRSQLQPRSPPLPMGGTASTPSSGTPPHRTEEWTEASSTSATTPLTAAQAPPKPDRPFESANQFQRLQPDESSDDGSHNSAMLLLTPADRDDAIPTPPAEDIVGAIGDEAGDIAPPPADVVSPVSAPAPTQLTTGSQADFLRTIGDLFETKLDLTST